MKPVMLALLAVMVGVPAMAQQHDASRLRLQVLNGKTGKPIAHHAVVLLGADGVPGHVDVPWGKMTTDDEGYVVLPDMTPMPLHVVVSVATLRSCAKAERNSFEIEKIAGGGVVSENTCSSRISLYPQAGMLVFFVRPETWLERMMK